MFRGGELPNGEIVTYGNVVELGLSDRYILFIRSEYYISPLVQVPNAALRVANVEGKDVVVNAAGHGLLVSGLHGLLSIGAVAASFDDRRAQLVDHPEQMANAEAARSAQNLALCSPLSTIVNELRLRSNKLARSPGAFPIAPKPWPAAYNRPESAATNRSEVGQ